LVVSVAGAVGSLSIMERGSNHLMAEWATPGEPNGIISEYLVICQVGEFQLHACRLLSAGIPRRRHGHRHPPEDPRRHVRHARSISLKLFLWQAQRENRPTRRQARHPRRHPREDGREHVDVGVGVVECQLYTATLTDKWIKCLILANSPMV